MRINVEEAYDYNGFHLDTEVEWGTGSQLEDQRELILYESKEKEIRYNPDSVEESFSLQWGKDDIEYWKYQAEFFIQERDRLIKKLEKIENLSRYAWELVYSNPLEAKEVFKMINAESA